MAKKLKASKIDNFTWLTTVQQKKIQTITEGTYEKKNCLEFSRCYDRYKSLRHCSKNCRTPNIKSIRIAIMNKKITYKTKLTRLTADSSMAIVKVRWHKNSIFKWWQKIITNLEFILSEIIGNFVGKKCATWCKKWGRKQIYQPTWKTLKSYIIKPTEHTTLPSFRASLVA